MRTGIGLGVALAFSSFLSALGIIWANDLRLSTDTAQNVQSIDPANGLCYVPNASLNFGSTYAASGILRFAASASAVTRRKADNLADLGVLTFGALDALTLGDANTGVVKVQGSKISATIASTERAFFDASGLTIPGLTAGRLAMVTTGGLLTDSGNSLTVGQVPRATGTGAVAFGQLDLANASAVTGVLPGANMGLATAGANGGINLAGDLAGDGSASTTPKIGSLTGVAGVVTGPSTAITIGASPSATGLLRTPNASTVLTFRNAANSADIIALASDAGNILYVGSGPGVASAATQLYLNSSANTYISNGGGIFAYFTTPGSAESQLVFNRSDIPMRLLLGACSSDVTAKTMTIQGANAWASAVTNLTGGIVQIQGGARTSTAGKRGPVRLQINGSTTENMVECCDVQPSATSASRVLALLRPTAVSPTEMPTGSGDLVMYLGDAAAAPTASPVSGCVIYSLGGTPFKRSSAGHQQALGGRLSAVAWPSDANYTAVLADYSGSIIELSGGLLTLQRNFVVPIVAGYQWVIFNNTSGVQAIQVIGSSGTGVVIANGKRATVYADGTNIVRVTADT